MLGLGEVSDAVDTAKQQIVRQRGSGAVLGTSQQFLQDEVEALRKEHVTLKAALQTAIKVKASRTIGVQNVPEELPPGVQVQQQQGA